MSGKVLGLSLFSSGCYLSCCIDQKPVLVAFRSFKEEGLPSFSFFKDSDKSLYSIETLQNIFNWAYRISAKSFPNSSNYGCLVSFPAITTQADQKTIISVAEQCGFTWAAARHTNVASASIHMPSLVGDINARSLILCVDGEEISACITEHGDGIFETLAISRQQLDTRDGEFLLNGFYTSLNYICDDISKCAKMNLSSDIDYCLLTGEADGAIVSIISEAISKKLEISSSSIVHEPKASALGIAIQGGVLEGSIEDTLVLDTTTHDIFTCFKICGVCNGMSTLTSGYGRIYTNGIYRNTTFPVLTFHSYVFSLRGKASVLIRIDELVRDKGDECDIANALNFKLDYKDIESRKVQLDIHYDIDANHKLFCTPRIIGNSLDGLAEITEIEESELSKIIESGDYQDINLESVVPEGGLFIDSLLDVLVDVHITDEEVGHEKPFLINETDKINVMIPQGIKNASTIRVEGKGNFQPATGLRGDLYLKILFKESPEENKYSADEIIAYASNAKSFSGTTLFNRVLSHIHDKNIEMQASSSKNKNALNMLSSIGAISATAAGLGGVAAALSMARVASLSTTNKSAWSHTEINQIKEVFDNTQNQVRSLTSRLGQPLGRFIRKLGDDYYLYSVFHSNNRGFNLVTLQKAHQQAPCFQNEDIHSIIISVPGLSEESIYNDLLESLYPFEIKSIKGIRLVKPEEAQQHDSNFSALSEAGLPYRFDLIEEDSFYAYKILIPPHSDF